MASIATSRAPVRPDEDDQELPAWVYELQDPSVIELLRRRQRLLRAGAGGALVLLIGLVVWAASPGGAPRSAAATAVAATPALPPTAPASRAPTTRAAAEQPVRSPAAARPGGERKRIALDRPNRATRLALKELSGTDRKRASARRQGDPSPRALSRKKPRR